MKSVVLLCLLLSLANAGREDFPYGISVEWNFITDCTVEFTLHVPDIVYTTWAWAGFGLKHSYESDLSMGHSDLITVYFDGTIIDDRHGVGDLLPPIDYKKGGTNDVDFVRETAFGGIHSFSFVRQLVTGDSHDIELVRDEAYIIMWAVGQSYDGGPIAHTDWNRGRQYMIFSQDYIDNGSDDYKGDGDGSYQRPENTLVAFN